MDYAYADSKNFADYLVEDQKIRKFTKKKLYIAGISKIEIERKELELERLRNQLQVAETEFERAKRAAKEELSTLSPDVRAAVTAMFDSCAPELGLDQGDEHTI